MNKKERTLRAMAGLQVDRVPVGFYTHFSAEDDAAVAGQVDWCKRTDMDVLCVETDGLMGFFSDTALRTVQDWKGIRPHGPESAYMQRHLYRAGKIAEAMQDGAAVYYMLFTPFSTIKHTFGGETHVMDLWREDKGAVQTAMQVIQEDNFTLSRLLKEKTGIDGLFVSLQNCEVDRFTPQEYVEALKPWDIRLLDYVNSLYEHNIVHMCSWVGTPNFIDLWQDYPYETVNWGTFIEKDLQLAQGRAFFKPGTTLMGGFDNRPGKILQCATPEQIKTYTKELIASAGAERLILCADCSVQQDTPDVNIRAVVEGAQEYAQGDR